MSNPYPKGARAYATAALDKGIRPERIIAEMLAALVDILEARRYG